ncbi:MAG: hypothetical protein M3R17_05175 [Bacteroidota bacterium]|nr:hypothetical protein [Bacteroidota bacterium]
MNITKDKILSAGLAFAGVIIFFFSFIFISAFYPGIGKKHSLIIAVYDGQAATNHIVHIQRISFVGGVPGDPENIMNVVTKQPGDRVPRIRFDLGANKIYRNRWVITSYGNVIDIEQKKVLVDGHDQFVRASGDSIVFYTNDISRGKFYSVLDLNTGVYAPVKSPSFRALTGQDVQVDCTIKNFKIYYYPPSAQKVELIKDAGFGEDVSLIPQTKPTCPLFWIDNENFLYPNYTSAHDNVAIMKVNFSTKTQEKIGAIDRLPENHQLSSFYKNADGDIIYSCARGHYKIDHAKKELTELQFFSQGNGFSIAAEETDKKGRVIKSGEQVIGTYYCFPGLTATTTGFIAFPYEMVLGEEHYLQGVAVYSEVTKKWKTVGDSDLCAVVGWTEE